MLSASYTAQDAQEIDLIYDYDPTTIEREDCTCKGSVTQLFNVKNSYCFVNLVAEI